MPAPDHSENHSVFYNKEIEGKDTFFQLPMSKEVGVDFGLGKP